MVTQDNARPGPRTAGVARVLAIASAPAGALLVAAIPLLFGRIDDKPVLTLGPAIAAVSGWLRGLADGSSFVYVYGTTKWNFFDTAPTYFMVSFAYVALAGSIGLAIGTTLGLCLRGRAARVASSVLGTLYAVPDFIMAIILQMATLLTLDLAGFKLGKISYDPAGGYILALPLALLTLYPLAFAFRTALRKSVEAEREPFAVFALAKGLSAGTVRVRHVGAAVIPAIACELPTLLGIMQANLFMAEYVFSLPGITRFLFQAAFSGRQPGWIERYQYSLAATILLGLMILYLAAWCFFRLALSLVRRALTGER